MHKNSRHLDHDTAATAGVLVAASRHTWPPRRLPHHTHTTAAARLSVKTTRSSAADAGLGLFTTRAIPRNALITEYVGPIIDRHQAKQLRRANAHSHVVRVTLAVVFCVG